MKLLLDENLSDRILPEIIDLYPESSHVKIHGLAQTDDSLIWAFAKEYGYAIVSKDSDFHQRSLVFGAPPKFIFLRVGNCSTIRISELLRANVTLISAFNSDPDASIFLLTWTMTE